MKRNAILAIAAGFVLTLATASTNAACSPNPCYKQFLQCRASGVSYYECYARYEDCLAHYGCPIP